MFKKCIPEVKHGLLVERAHESRQKAEQERQKYEALNEALKLEERKAAIQVKNEKKKLEIRRKDVLRADTHEYAWLFIRPRVGGPG